MELNFSSGTLILILKLTERVLKNFENAQYGLVIKG